MDDRAAAGRGGALDMLRKLVRDRCRGARQAGVVAHRHVDQLGPRKGGIDRRLRDDARADRGLFGKEAARGAMDAAAADFVAAEQDRGQRASVMGGREADIFKVGPRCGKDDRCPVVEPEIAGQPGADRIEPARIIIGRDRLVEPGTPAAQQGREGVIRNAADRRRAIGERIAGRGAGVILVAPRGIEPNAAIAAADQYFDQPGRVTAVGVPGAGIETFGREEHRASCGERDASDLPGKRDRDLAFSLQRRHQKVIAVQP